MNTILLKSKIHRAVVTHTQLEYDGSCGIDSDYMKEVDIKPFEQIHIYNLTNGERLITYAIEAEAGAHKASVGDLVIIAAYGSFEERELDEFKPKILRL